MGSKSMKSKSTKPCKAKKQTSSKVASRASYVMNTSPEVRKQLEWIRGVVGTAIMVLEQSERVAGSALGQRENRNP